MLLVVNTFTIIDHMRFVVVFNKIEKVCNAYGVDGILLTDLAHFVVGRIVVAFFLDKVEDTRHNQERVMV